jgi:molybdate transport system substrate-binding protein
MQQAIRMVGLFLIIFLSSALGAADRGLTVYAAASLTNVLQDVAAAFTADSKIPVKFSFGASSMLAKQIEAGAPADVFMSADQDWMDYLQTRSLIAAETRANVVANDLVLVAPVNSTQSLKIVPGFALAAALGESGRLAMGDPWSVPAGMYARAALVRLGVWSSVGKRIVAADNVRTALNFVARGEAPLGIVYATDASVEPKVRIVDVFPSATHDPIAYPAAATARSSAEAAAFVRYLTGARARAIFIRAGFGAP